MYFDNDQLIARFEAISDAVNRALENSPEIADIPDEAFEEQELETMISANFALLQAVRQRQQVIELVADNVRRRIAASES